MIPKIRTYLTRPRQIGFRDQPSAAACIARSAIDPKNPNLTYAAAPDWVPTDQDIANLNAEIAQVGIKRVADYAKPDGNLIGTQGGDIDVRNLPGGAQAAQAAYDYLSVGGTPYGGEYPGEMVVLPGNIGWVGLRNNNEDIPTIDINVPSTFGSIRFHYSRN